MNEQQVTRIGRVLQEALGSEALTEIGKETGFAVRLRQVTPFRLALSLCSAMACGRVETIADLRRSFHAVSGQTVEYKPFHNQLAKATFPVFMFAVFERLLDQLVVRTLEPIPGHVLGQFSDVVIQDGSSFAIHAGLHREFPGRFRATSPAAVELHTTLSLLGGQPLRVSIAPDADAERTFLPTPEQLSKKLFLGDRGYMDLDFCGAVDAAGGSFIVRFSQSINPTILGGTLDGRRIPDSMVGLTFKECKKRLALHSADLEVEWDRQGQSLRLRLVLLWNPTTREHMILATNLPRGAFRARHVRCLYSLRWQVELLFKEWKSYANLKAFCTRKAPIAEGLIWAALCAAVLKRFLAHSAQAVSSGVEVSTRTAAMALSHHLPGVIDAMISKQSIRHPLEKLLSFLATTCRRAHPSRDRSSGRLAWGLRPAFDSAFAKN